MKVSAFIREYQITGKVPESKRDVDAMVAFWSGWLMGAARSHARSTTTMEQSIALALKISEFIEERARE